MPVTVEGCTGAARCGHREVNGARTGERHGGGIEGAGGSLGQSGTGELHCCIWNRAVGIEVDRDRNAFSRGQQIGRRRNSQI